MKFILTKCCVLFFAAVLLSFYGCKTSSSQQASQSAAESKAMQERMEKMNAALHNQPAPEPVQTIQEKNIVEGSVPPDDKKIIMFYYVQSGDTLAKIAKKVYGDKTLWKSLATVNNLRDPNRIYAGDFIHYELSPSTKSFAEAYQNTSVGKIVAKRGDTLSSLSKLVFGRTADWRVLWKENPHIKNPDRIAVGQEITFHHKAIAMKLNSAPEEKIQPVSSVSPVSLHSRAEPTSTAEVMPEAAAPFPEEIHAKPQMTDVQGS